MNFAAVVRTMTTARSAEESVSKYDWEALSQELSSYGCAVMKELLSPEECREIARLYNDVARFRSHVHMGRNTALAKANIVISNIHCPIWLVVFARHFIHASPRSPMTGTSAWELISATLSATLTS